MNAPGTKMETVNIILRHESIETEKVITGK